MPSTSLVPEKRGDWNVFVGPAAKYHSFKHKRNRSACKELAFYPKKLVSYGTFDIPATKPRLAELQLVYDNSQKLLIWYSLLTFQLIFQTRRVQNRNTQYFKIKTFIMLLVFLDSNNSVMAPNLNFQCLIILYLLLYAIFVILDIL